MGRKGRRKFERKLVAVRRYRNMFVLATEGAKTEPIYFNTFNNENTVVHVKHLKGGRKSSPGQVLKRMNNYLKDNPLKDGDEAWLIVDHDLWTEDQLNQLYNWSQTNRHYGLAVSNPMFEYWLLLHFEDGSSVTNARNCMDRLKRYLPNFEKGHVEVEKLLTGINDAITRAKMKDSPPCADWPRKTGTTIYRLVEKLAP